MALDVKWLRPLSKLFHAKRLSKPIVLIASQRSGTNLFRSLLRTTGNFADYDEILHSAFSEENKPDFAYYDWSKFSYFNYRISRIADNPRLSIPLQENVKELFDGYFEYLASLDSEKPYFLVDIKYNSLHHFNSAWQYLEAPKNIFSLLNESDYHVIHLIRENLFNLYISLLVSSALNTYVLQKEQTLQIPKIEINIKNLLYKMNHLAKEQKYVRDCLKPLRKVEEFSYESLIAEEGNLAQPTVTRLNAFLNEDFTYREKSNYKKMVTDPWSFIINAEEVHRALEASQFSRFLHSK